jgi:hypothetical protein
VRDLVPDPVEVVEGEIDLCLVGDREQVQHGVGRAAERHHDSDRVLERVPGQDLPGRDAAAQQLDDGLAGPAGVPVAAAVHRRRRGTAGQRHPERLSGRRHGVRGEHPAARALARADRSLDRVDLLAADQPAGACADGLERVDDVDVTVAELARQDRPGVQEHGSQVEPGRGHQHPGQRLVAAGQQYRAVQPLGLHHGLDRVGDDLAAHQ